MVDLESHHELRRNGSVHPATYSVDFVDTNDQGYALYVLGLRDLFTQPTWPTFPLLSHVHSRLTTALIAAADVFDPDKRGYPEVKGGFHGANITIGDSLKGVIAFPHEPNESDPFLGGIVIRGIHAKQSDGREVVACGLKFDTEYTPTKFFGHVFHKLEVPSTAVLIYGDDTKLTEEAPGYDTPLLDLPVHAEVGRLITEHLIKLAESVPQDTRPELPATYGG